MRDHPKGDISKTGSYWDSSCTSPYVKGNPSLMFYFQVPEVVNDAGVRRAQADPGLESSPVSKFDC